MDPNFRFFLDLVIGIFSVGLVFFLLSWSDEEREVALTERVLMNRSHEIFSLIYSATPFKFDRAVFQEFSEYSGLRLLDIERLELYHRFRNTYVFARTLWEDERGCCWAVTFLYDPPRREVESELFMLPRDYTDTDSHTKKGSGKRFAFIFRAP